MCCILVCDPTDKKVRPMNQTAPERANPLALHLGGSKLGTPKSSDSGYAVKMAIYLGYTTIKNHFCLFKAGSFLPWSHSAPQIDHLVSKQTSISVRRTWRNFRAVSSYFFLSLLVVQQLFCAVMCVCIDVDLHYVIAGSDVVSSGDDEVILAALISSAKFSQSNIFFKDRFDCRARIKRREDMLKDIQHKHKIVIPEQ